MVWRQFYFYPFFHFCFLSRSLELKSRKSLPRPQCTQLALAWLSCPASLQQMLFYFPRQLLRKEYLLLILGLCCLVITLNLSCRGYSGREIKQNRDKASSLGKHIRCKANDLTIRVRKRTHEVSSLF